MVSVEVKKVKLSEVKKNPDNPRKISERDLGLLVKSLHEFPEMMNLREIIVDETMTVLGGNMRLKALREIGEECCIVKIVSGLTPEQKREFIVKDNSSFGEWDLQLLQENWSDLPLLDWGAGLPEDWLSNKKADPDEFDAEAAAEEITEPITRRGDIWLLGRHRLMCGDSTEADNVNRLWGGGSPMLMVTDPPYGVEYDASWRKVLNKGAGGNNIATGKVLNDHNADWRDAWKLFSGDVAYVWHAGTKAQIVADSLSASGLEIRAQIIWAKSSLAISRGHYHHQHEPCWYAVRKGKTANWKGGRKNTTLWRFVDNVIRQGEEVFIRRMDAESLWALSGDESTIWEIDKPTKNETGHSTQKPIECMARPIRNHKSDGVYDPFLGSGTTLIAAEQLGRTCYGMELSPIYCDVICKRFLEFTGIQPVLEEAQ